MIKKSIEQEIREVKDALDNWTKTSTSTTGTHGNWPGNMTTSGAHTHMYSGSANTVYADNITANIPQPMEGLAGGIVRLERIFFSFIFETNDETCGHTNWVMAEEWPDYQFIHGMQACYWEMTPDEKTWVPVRVLQLRRPSTRNNYANVPMVETVETVAIATPEVLYVTDKLKDSDLFIEKAQGHKNAQVVNADAFHDLVSYGPVHAVRRKLEHSQV